MCQDGRLSHAIFQSSMCPWFGSIGLHRSLKYGNYANATNAKLKVQRKYFLRPWSWKTSNSTIALDLRQIASSNEEDPIHTNFLRRSIVGLIRFGPAALVVFHEFHCFFTFIVIIIIRKGCAFFGAYCTSTVSNPERIFTFSTGKEATSTHAAFVVLLLANLIFLASFSYFANSNFFGFYFLGNSVCCSTTVIIGMFSILRSLSHLFMVAINAYVGYSDSTFTNHHRVK